jgi:hypothetical protein
MCSLSLTAKLARSSTIFAAAAIRAFASPAFPGGRALDSQQMPIGAARTKAGTVNAAIIGYYDSTMFFGSLAPSTQIKRRCIFALLPQKFIVLTLDKLKPSVAISWLVAIRHLMTYAVSANLCETDPTQGIKLKMPKTDGIYTWAEHDIAVFEEAHAIGTRARLALALGLFTAQRGDVIRLGRQHVRGDGIQLKQAKTGAMLDIPVHAELRAIIDATPGEHLTFFTTKTGRPYRGDAFSEQFRAWCDAGRAPTRM